MLADGGLDEVRCCLLTLGVAGVRAPTVTAALELQQLLRARVAFRPERHDVSGGRFEMLRRPWQLLRAGGDCDDLVAFAGLAWQVLTGVEPAGSVFWPDLQGARHVYLLCSTEPWCTVDGAPGAPIQWPEGAGEVVTWSG